MPVNVPRPADPPTPNAHELLTTLEMTLDSLRDFTVWLQAATDQLDEEAARDESDPV